ncbi:MAG: Gfo/Idh/MocA family oxidoreductase [bacterium]|jgi:UDP-N-acetyl-2-amino-2-deoxyglucuronate dehydrogenase|nr:Gfo/Idh/MocA family oxidoreductase [bacterium]
MADARKLKIALVGCGGIAQAHWKGIQAHSPRIHVTTVVETDGERLGSMAKQTGATPFASLEEALAHGDFEAVDILLPHALHEEAAVLAFAAGKHVVLEKPMAHNLASAQRILSAAQEAGTVFMVAEQAQYWPDARAVRDLIQTGAIGDIITARAFFGGPSRPGRGGLRPWRYDMAMAGGGITMDGGAHWIRPLRMWLGEIDEVVAVTARPQAEMDGESLARAILRFRSGVVAVFDALHAGAVMGPGEEFRVTGTEGEILIEKGAAGRVLLFDGENPDGKVVSAQKNEGRSAAFGYELNDFVETVLDGTPLEASAEYSLGELRTAFAIYRSAESRQWEKVWA